MSFLSLRKSGNSNVIEKRRYIISMNYIVFFIPEAKSDLCKTSSNMFFIVELGLELFCIKNPNLGQILIKGLESIESLLILAYLSLSEVTRGHVRTLC